MQNAKCYLKGYPRPQFVRNNWGLLDGEWSFSFDDNDIGEKQRWFQSDKLLNKIIVPFAYQTLKSEVNDNTYHKIMWYTKKQLFEIKENERIILNFEGVDYFAKLWVNGIFIGEHKGGYCRFSFDITNAISDKKETIITLRVEDDNDCCKPRGKQTWLNHPFGCWYLPTSGIWKSVWYEKVNSTYIKRIKMTPKEDNYHVEFEYDIDNFKEGYYLQTVVEFNNKIIADDKLKLIRKNHTYDIDFTNDLEGFKIHWWTIENPLFYDIKFYLYDNNNKLVDEVGSYFGFRFFKAEKNHLTLNLNPVYLRLVLNQGYFRNSGLTGSEEELLNDILYCKELGFNGIRMHQKIEDERFYYLCDMLGMFVFCEMPSSYEFKDNSIDNVTSEWMEVVKQNYNHQSIVVWVPINESWGVNQLTSSSRQRHFTQTLYHLTKSYDPFRPVISNDGWEQTYSDIVTFHNYAQDYKDLKHFYEDIKGVLDGENRNDYTQLRIPFVGNTKYNGQPILIDEFAGIGYQNKDDEGWGYGDKVSSEELYVKRLSSLIKVIREMDYICGFCVTQLTDTYQEINGLMDFDRNYKANKEKLRKAIIQK